MSSKLKALLLSALALSIGTDIGFVFVLYKLVGGYTIAPDNRNSIELGLAIFILVLTGVALCLLVRNMIRRRENESN